MKARIVFGMPAYNRPDSLAQTIESILGQTRTDFALMIVDDAPGEATDRIIDRYRRSDPRISHERNTRRLGMVGNWRKCFEQARRTFPRSTYFAWVSDHDFWHPRWLEMLVAELDSHPDVVLAYPQTLRLYPTSPSSRSRIPRSFETVGIKDPVERVRRAAYGIYAGDMIYGLFRADAVAAAGVFRPVLMPDRQLLVALAALGEFRQVPELLWYRQVPRIFSLERQRASFFTGRVPLHTYLPCDLQHCALMMWDFTICGRGGPSLSRAAGLRAAAAQLASTRERSRQQREAMRARGKPVTTARLEAAAGDDRER